MTPQRVSAVAVLRELRAHLGIAQQSLEKDDLSTLQGLVFTLGPRRHLMPDELAWRVEQAIAEMRLEQGGA